MDSGSYGNRPKETQVCKSDNTESVMVTMEENVPKILSPELYDVFHVFTNMLDIKSFTKFAMTSKNMYKRCMEDTAIKINVDVKKLEAIQENESVEIRWPSLDDPYGASLGKMPCKFNVRAVEVHGFIEVSELHTIMKEIGVHRIQELEIRDNCRDLEAVITIVKEFGVKSVHIWPEVSSEILSSVLQLNLENFRYNSPVSVDFILEIDSPIREISLTGIPTISKGDLWLISSKIESGPLSRMIVHSDAIDWDIFDVLPFDQEEPLPDYRPLLLARRPEMPFGIRSFWEHWILHSNGGVTKCAMYNYDMFSLQIYKCEPWEYPWILRNEDDVFKSLVEKDRFRDILCSQNLFRTFWNSFEILDPYLKGPLPTHRPLYSKVSDHFYWMLDKEEKLMKCTWEDSCARWSPRGNYVLPSDGEIKPPALAKHMFWQLLNELEESSSFIIHCEGHREFHSWFDEFEKLDFEYSGDLPSTRPLIFEKFYNNGMSWAERVVRVVLFEDRLFECGLGHESVIVRRCSYSMRPPLLFNPENVVELLSAPYFVEKDSCKISMEMFHIGLKLFAKSPSATRKHLPILERVTTNVRVLIKEYWYEFDGRVRKVVWEEGRVRLEKRSDLRDSPPNFMKKVFKYFAEHEPESCDESFKLELAQFRSCLEQFTVVPFDYSGPLSTDSPMAFVKNEIRHTCQKGGKRKLRCNCRDFNVFVWFMWNGMRVTCCSWEAKRPKTLLFTNDNVRVKVLPALKSKEYLKNLLQGKYDKSPSYDWYGPFNDFRSCLNGYVKLPFNYDRQLPEERPIFFNSRLRGAEPVYFILREDGTVIECKKKGTSHISMSLLSDKERVPPALKSLVKL